MGLARDAGQEPPSAPTVEGELAAIPESLSLEDLLSPGPAVSPPISEPETAAPEGVRGEPVFDLTSEMEGPALPLVEVGTGKPPILSVEDLLGPTEAVPPGRGMMGFPELELELLPGSNTGEAPGRQDLPALTAPLDLEALLEVPLPAHEAIVPEAAVAEDRKPVPVPEAPPVVPVVEAPAAAVDTSLAAVPESPEISAFVAPVAEAPEVRVAPPVAPPIQGPPSPAEATALPEGPEALAPEMATMRQAVTEKVARELARDLSDKLLERIERIVWEVVPDLAEILIAKEIERIRALAEGKESS
jgi:hypothetical protein